MAGDWIKVEHASLDKPEIAIAAERLGISDGDAFLLFVRYWVWLDQNLDESRAGLVPFVSRRSLDKLFRCPGFAAILEVIHWASFDDEQHILTVINWQYHNGKSAKSRASEQKKKARQRANVSRFCPVVVPIAPGPEKRREEIKSIERSPKPRLAEPTDEHQTLAAALGVDCQTEFLKYRDWLSAAGKRQKDEQAGFRNWLRKAAEFAPAKPVSQKTAAHMAAKIPAHEELTPMPENVKALLDAFVRNKAVR